MLNIAYSTTTISCREYDNAVKMYKGHISASALPNFKPGANIIVTKAGTGGYEAGVVMASYDKNRGNIYVNSTVATDAEIGCCIFW